MNFVLDFFVDKNTHPFDIGEMRLLFASTLYFYEKLQSHKSPTWRIAREFVYDNGTTGVHFTLRFNKPEKFDLTAGKLTYSGLCLEMDLPKASFFGYEAMKVVAAVMKSLNLLAACSSHMSDEPEPPRRYTYDELVVLWMNANEQEVAEEAKKKDNIYYAERNKLLYWWRFTSELRKLQLSMEKKEIVVPEIGLYAIDNSTEAVTICSWTGLVRTVLPVVDYVYLERPARPSTRGQSRPGQRISSRLTPTRKVERGMARFKDVVRAVKGFTRQVEKPLPYIIYARNHAPAPMRHGIQEIKLTSPDNFKPLTPDDLIDVFLEPRITAETGDDKGK